MSASATGSVATGAGGRFRWLSAVHVLLWVALLALVLSGVGLVLTVVTTAAGLHAVPLVTEVAGHLPAQERTVPTGVELSGPSTISLTDYSVGQALLWTAGQAGQLAVAFGVVVPLLRAVQDAVAGHPFTAKNVRRLRTVGLVVLFGQLVAGGVQTLTSWALASSVLGDRLSGPNLQVSWTAVLTGAAVVAVAEVVRHGVCLREELDEVI